MDESINMDMDESTNMEINVPNPQISEESQNVSIAVGENSVSSIRSDSSDQNTELEDEAHNVLSQSGSRQSAFQSSESTSSFSSLEGQKCSTPHAESSEIPTAEDNDNNDGFVFDIEKKECYFETDHPAFKYNEDYRKVLYVYVVLIAARRKLIRNVERIKEARDEALADPIAYVSKIQRGEDLNLPGRLKIPEIPVIDWSKYDTPGVSQPVVSKRKSARQSTRASSIASCNVVKHEVKHEVKEDLAIRLAQKVLAEQPKHPSFNQPWTAEEQKRLEDLLIDFPSEEIESRRWEKIAHTLGNRTPAQVASRVQKYFIRLMRAGLPIPGRQPNTTYLRKPRRNVLRHEPSTFLVSHTPSVYINENDMYKEYLSSLGGGGLSDDSTDTEGDMDDIDSSLKYTEEYKELQCINRVLKKKHKATLTTEHTGYKCFHCGCSPIIGIRWHCTECLSTEQVDFCNNCVHCMTDERNHLASHHMEPIQNASVAVLDKDYMQFHGSSYNYLDPNYMPAV